MKYTKSFLPLLIFVGLWAQAQQEPQANTPNPVEAPPRAGLAAFGAGAAGSDGLFPTKDTVLNYGGYLSSKKDPSKVEHERLSLSWPMIRPGKGQWSTNAQYASTNLSDAPTLTGGTDGQGGPFPASLQKVELGAQYSEFREGGRLVGGKIAVGSASDKPFYGYKETTFTLSGFYSFPSSKEGRWFWVVMLSNNSTILNYLPIPGFVYIYQTPTFMGLFGIPFAAIAWTPVAPWLFSASIFGPSMNMEVLYGHKDQVQLYTGLAWSQQSYLRQGRINGDYRLFIDEKKTFVGLKSTLPIKGLSTDLQIGRAFARSIFEGTRFDRKEGGRADLGDSDYLSWNFNWKF